MWTDDDCPTPTTWRRLRQRLTTVDEGALLRWTLIANAGLVALFCAVSVLHMLGTWASSLLTLVSGGH